MISPPKNAANRVDFLLHIATISGDVKNEIQRQRAPIHAKKIEKLVQLQQNYTNKLILSLI